MMQKVTKFTGLMLTAGITASLLSACNPAQATIEITEAVTEPIVQEIAINQEHFPDEAFRVYVSATFDTNNDGVLDQGEIDEVTEIIVPEAGISSLQGLEYFTELTRLECNSNSLTQLNLSHNEKLQSVLCSGNQLTELDARACPELKYLVCNNNKLTSLDISGNQKLLSLQCVNNQLKALDISNNQELDMLTCELNSITELNLSANPHILDYLQEGSEVHDGVLYTAYRSAPLDDGSDGVRPCTFECDAEVSLITEPGSGGAEKVMD